MFTSLSFALKAGNENNLVLFGLAVGITALLYQFRLHRNDKRGHGSAVSLQLIVVGTRHCRVLRLYHSDRERN